MARAYPRVGISREAGRTIGDNSGDNNATVVGACLRGSFGHDIIGGARCAHDSAGYQQHSQISLLSQRHAELR